MSSWSEGNPALVNRGHCLVQLVDLQGSIHAMEYMIDAWRAGQLDKDDLYFVFLNDSQDVELFLTVTEMYDFQRLFFVSVVQVRLLLHAKCNRIQIEWLCV